MRGRCAVVWRRCKTKDKKFSASLNLQKSQLTDVIRAQHDDNELLSQAWVLKWEDIELEQKLERGEAI